MKITLEFETDLSLSQTRQILYDALGPLIRIHEKDYGYGIFNYTMTKKFFYNYSSLVDYVEKNDRKDIELTGYNKSSGIANFFEECRVKQNSYYNMFIDNKAAYFIAEFSDGELHVTYNYDSLKKISFMQMFGPYQAYQEISMFVNNLAVPEKPIPKMSDEDMASIKGFDKFSFRKDKRLVKGKVLAVEIKAN
jgi:hypothetical protein